MRTKLARFGCIAFIVLTASCSGNCQALGQFNLNLSAFQGRITADYGPGWDDSPHIYDILIHGVIPSVPCEGWDCNPTNCWNCLRIPLATNSVLVNGGLFTTPITIPTELLLSASNGLFLEFSVRTNGGTEFTTLSPMQRVTATPFATVAQTVLGPISASSLSGPLGADQLGGSYSNALSFSNPGNVFVGNGSLLSNVNAATIGGLFIRRIDSTSAAVNQIVARNDQVTLERDGTSGGMLIRYPAGSYHQAITSTAVTSSGAQMTYYQTLAGPATGSKLQIFNGATNVVQFHCTFGDSSNSGHFTEVDMFREGTDNNWTGTLRSTYNQ